MLRLVARRYLGGAWAGTTVIVGSLPIVPRWLRLRIDDGNQATLLHSTASPNDESASTTIASIVAPTWVGFALLTFNAAPFTASSATFDNWRAFTPNGLRVFNWYAYRDPALPGQPDMRGAQRVVENLKPAHTEAAAVQSKALLCDDPMSLCDDGPLGG